ncbi:uncharacterized protein N7459_007720 [Penicillium hispanicum]|uniref:uncharacterized protein n=1 Tax=Penicillium hispanicum TaxID=1080232 RepID=UPI0025403DED|nr:uncharacterized protein N7459_007720 [Penicillium hispanicum]KAJ5578756.1 hypothetical protein N7459_007720 [Penicillium hispanicum]
MSSLGLLPRQYESNPDGDGGMGMSNIPTAIYPSNDSGATSEAASSTALYYPDQWSATSSTASPESTPVTTSTSSDSSLTPTGIVILPGTSAGSVSSTLATPTSSPTTTASATAATTSKDDDAHAAPGASSGSWNSTKTKLAIAIPIAVVGLLCIGALVFFLLRRRKRQRNAHRTVQRKDQPPFDRTSQSTAVSTSELVEIAKISTPEPVAAGPPRLPVLDLPSSFSRDVEDGEHSPGGSTAQPSPSLLDEPHAEIGLAIAVPMNQRLNTTAEKLPRLSRPPSAATMGAGPATRMSFQDARRDGADTVSMISDLNEQKDHEQDFDDMSSVSSLNDEDTHHSHDDHPFR